MAPLVTSPRSDFNKLDIDFRVVLLPAPLPPNSAVMPPFSTDKLTPLTPKIILL